MRTDPRERPAALAVLFYVSGLLAAKVVVSAVTAILGLTLVSLLVMTLRRRRSGRAAVLLLLAALGLFAGARVEARRSAEMLRFDEGSPDAFRTIRFQIEDGWTPREDGAWRLRGRAFELIDDRGGRFVVQRRIHVLLYDSPPAIDGAEWLVARGFLRTLDGGACVLSVKSAGLLRSEGEASRIDPRTWNRFLSRQLDEASAGSERARLGNALVQALVLGRGGLVPWEVIDLYQRGGTYHLLVFSGVQIAMIAGLVRWILIRLRRRRAADVALLLVCLLMPRFVGADPSVSRSAMMIGLLLGCWLWERPTDAANLVFVAALIRLILVPEDLADPGFALTYSATAGILVVGRALATGRGRIGRLVAYGLGAELGTTPFTLFFFNRATIGGSLVTLVVSPLVTLMLAAGFVAVALCPVSPDATCAVLELVGRLNDVVLWVNRFVAEELRLSVIAASPTPVVLVGAVVAALVASAPAWRKGGLLVAICLSLPLASTLINSMPDKSVEVAIHFLDVGQGDATLVVSRGRAMLVDGGGSPTNPAFGMRTLIPRLAQRRALRIDTVVLSHPHPDHCGGLVTVLRDLEVSRLVISRRHVATVCGAALIDAAVRRHIAVEDAESSHGVKLGVLEGEIFAANHRFRRASENNSSLLVTLRAGGHRLLLAGDIEREAELVLLEQERERLPADILKVPHHGSRSSTTAAFLDAVSPRIAIVSSGRRNRFGHPHPEPMARLLEAGARVEQTAVVGNVEVQLRQGHLFLTKEFDSGGRGP